MTVTNTMSARRLEIPKPTPAHTHLPIEEVRGKENNEGGEMETASVDRISLYPQLFLKLRPFFQ